MTRLLVLPLLFVLACSAEDAIHLGEVGGDVPIVEVGEPADSEPVSVVSPPPCPSEMAIIGQTCIDRYEAHLRLESGERHPHHSRPRPGAAYVAASAPDVRPQSYISRDEAAAACDRAGKRLCTRGEWMAACRGTPAGPVGPAGDRACNHGKAHLLTLLGRGYDYEDDFNDPSLSLEPGFLAKTGAHERCISDAGVHDMVGNVHEWVSDAVTSQFLTAFQHEVPRQFQYVAIGNAVFMGGFFSTRAELGPGCLFTTVAHDAGYHDYSTGFRCCADAGSAGR